MSKVDKKVVMSQIDKIPTLHDLLGAMLFSAKEPLSVKQMHQTLVHLLGDIIGDRFTVVGKMEDLREVLLSKPRVSISALFEPMRARGEVICTFLAVLELIKSGEVRIVQDRTFSEIIVEKTPIDEKSTIHRMAATTGAE